MATDNITAVENYGKEQQAFAKALVDASTQRQQIMTDLGASIMTQSGRVITPTQAAKMLGPSGTGLPKTAKITTGFGEGALATNAKDEVAAAYTAARDIQNRGVGEGGLTGQARTIGVEAGNVANQQAIEAGLRGIATVDASVAAAQQQSDAAKAILNTVRGIKPKKKGGV